MAQNTKTWIIAIVVIAAALFVGGMYTQKTHPIFSIYSISGRTCSSWLTVNLGLPATTTAPFNWQYTSTQTRCVTSMADSIDAVTGAKCTVNYNTGACSSCTPDCSCAANTCTGQTCSNGCSGTCSGTKSCSCTPVSCAANTCTGTTCTNNCGTVEQGTKTCTSNGCLITDTDGDGKVGRNELGTAINRWVTGT